MKECFSDEDVQALAEGRATPEARIEALLHVEACDACRALVGAAFALRVSNGASPAGERPELASTPPPLARGTLGALEAGTRVGRYVVLSTAGVGGMGVVYVAFDPELDRKVALKLLRGEGGAAARERLLREAQLTARLSHPNINPVFDVGSFGRTLYVAMELVDGETLADWLTRAPRTWREIALVFQAAGAGLAAAHRAGVVHRDFKPDNVLVSRDARVRVTDFGLARATDATAPRGGEPFEPSPESPASDLDALTRTGQVVGTPAYMAPEQFEPERFGGAAQAFGVDQFAFCVALYGALFRQRPFEGGSFEKLRSEVLAGRVRPAPRGARVPAWLTRLVMRGLRREPAERFADMDALLRALTAGLRRRERFSLGGALALGVVLAVVLGVRELGRSTDSPCDGAEAAFGGAWSAAVRDAVGGRVRSTGAPGASESAERVLAAGDVWAREWIATHREACEATRVHGHQSAALLDRRMACLGEGRRELAALTAMLREADRAMTGKAAQAMLSLPRPRRCDEALALRVTMEPEPSQRAEVERQREALAAARAAWRASRFAQARDAAAALQAPLGTLGFAPLQAQAALLVGQSAWGLGRHDEARAALRQSAALALVGRDEETALRALADAAWVRGIGRGDAQGALAELEPLRSVTTRAELSAELRTDLVYYDGALRFEVGQHAAARRAFDTGLVLAQQTFGRDHPYVGDLLSALARVERVADEPRAALEHSAEALRVFERAFGRHHTKTAAQLNNHGGLLLDLGRAAEALDCFERALAVRRALLPVGHPATVTTEANAGSALIRLERAAEGHLRLQRALDELLRVLGPEHPRLSILHEALGGALVALRRPAEALERFAEARRLILVQSGGRQNDPRLRKLAQLEEKARALRPSVEPQD